MAASRGPSSISAEEKAPRVDFRVGRRAGHHVGRLGVALLLCASIASAQQAISVNFSGKGGRSVQQKAGLVPAAGWNNVAGGLIGNPLRVLDSSGKDRGTKIVFSSASAGFRLNPPGTSANAAIYDGQIVAAQTQAVSVTLIGIPYAKYDVHAYFGHGPSWAGKSANLSIGAATRVFRNEDLTKYKDPIAFRPVTTTTSPGAIGNCASVLGVTGTTLSLTLSHGNGRSGLAGLQIVEAGSSDSDKDGLDDAWERRWFGNLSQGPKDDPDKDQLDNLGEFNATTVPIDADSDDDRSLDGAEIRRGTDPLDPDSDDDRLLDGVETATGRYLDRNDTGSDPKKRDSDGDKVHDGAEVRRGFDPNDATRRPKLPNVILIMVDDLGWGELGSYGQKLIRTPQLDRMAKEGMRFTQFYTGSPVCGPSRCVLLTGKHTGTSYIRNNGNVGGGYQRALLPNTPTIGRMMQDAGYTTSCIGKWGLGGPGTSGEPRKQGFDHFFGHLGQVQAHWFYPPHLWRNESKVLYPRNNGIQGPKNAGKDHSHDQMTKEALGWIDAQKDRPFFMYLCWTIPHVSLQEPPHSDPAKAALGQTAIQEFYSDVKWTEPNANFKSNHYTSHAQPRRGYAAMISAMDRDVGRIIDRLKAHKIDDNTLILFTSDNGATWCCGVDYKFFNSNGGLRSTKGSVYEGGVRAPLIARWPGKIKPSTVTQHVGATWDIYDTLAELVDEAPAPEGDGVSFLPTLTAKGCQAEHDLVYWEYLPGGKQRAVRVGDYKAVRIGNAGDGARVQLFDLKNDPGESRDIGPQNPSVLARLTRALDAAHRPSHLYFRGRDEFPVIRNATLAAQAPAFELRSGSGVGWVSAPLLRDHVRGFGVDYSMKVTSGNGAFVLASGTSATSHVRFELDAGVRRWRIEYGSQRIDAPLAANDNPARTFELRAWWDPATGRVELRDRGNKSKLLVAGQLTNAPKLAVHYGHSSRGGSVVFSAIRLAYGARDGEDASRGATREIGAGCRGSAGVPELRPLGGSQPRIGSCFEQQLFWLPTNAAALGLLGASSARWGTIPLPLALDGLGMNGCSLRVSPEFWGVISISNRVGRWSIPLPSSPALLGIAFYQQALVIDPKANRFGATTSNATEALIGAQ